MVIQERTYSEKHCFYCGALLRGKATREHVFPRWLQDKFNLRHQTIHLLNGTTIRYANLTVPCCSLCNNVHLAKLERKVKRVLFEEPIWVARREAADLFTWAIKILLGVVYRERFLPRDRRTHGSETILPDELRNAFELSHFFVQRLRAPMAFSAMDLKLTIPGSIFVFNLQSPDHVDAQFDFRDDILNLCVFMRMGTRGLIAVADGGALEGTLGSTIRRDARRKLHPLQFEEMGANCFYKASLFNRSPAYIIVEAPKGYQIIQGPIAGMSSRPIYEDWDVQEYAKFLSFFTGIPLEHVNPQPNRVRTWMKDPEGKPLRLDIRKHPWREPPLQSTQPLRSV